MEVREGQEARDGGCIDVVFIRYSSLGTLCLEIPKDFLVSFLLTSA